MSESLPATVPLADRLNVKLHAHGAVAHIEGAGMTVNAYPGNETEGGPTNLWLRWHCGGGAVEITPLLGPQSPLQFARVGSGMQAHGVWHDVGVRLQLRVAADALAWFWHVELENRSSAARELDLILVQDLALAPYASIRLNEHYVSHYIDLTPLEHPASGWVLAARQNQAADGRNPALLMGSLGRTVAYATDALQVQGLVVRAGARPQGLVEGLPSLRLQHEHALIALQDKATVLASGTHTRLGFFGQLQADHAAALGAADLARADTTRALPEATPVPWSTPAHDAAVPTRSLFARADWLAAMELDADDLARCFPTEHRHEEWDDGSLLSFFHGDATHVVLRAKELRTQRPHGHMLRSGRHLVPDETALTSTVWMGGVFHSMLTQGHVSINRFLSTVRGWLGFYRSQGQRIFIDTGAGWVQLGTPSAFEIAPDGCRWWYRHEAGLLEVRSGVEHEPQALTLAVRIVEGDAVRLLITHHIALAGDDGSAGGAPLLSRRGDAVFVSVPADSDLDKRFPGGGFLVEPVGGSGFEQVNNDAGLYADGQSRSLPFLCITSGLVREFGLRISGHLLQAAAPATAPAPDTAPLPQWSIAGSSPAAAAAQRLADILPWYQHNALVHYLSPRGLEQYSGGGWGTRDVCQGPLEMLLALGRTLPVRDLLCRVFAAQNADGDWPQWFMFFERERHIRAGDSHGDIVFWPLLGLAQYLLATGDVGLLDKQLPFYAATGNVADSGSVWQHVQRALALIAARRIPGTALAAYGHGDWNDSLQPADPRLREHLCSAWTVTLHHQMLSTLAQALLPLGRSADAAALRAEADTVQVDFQRLLVHDGVVTGYALFDPGQPVQCLLHPADTLTGLRYSLLPMMHAILGNLLSPEQAQAHLGLMNQHLSGPDGARLFDRPLPYRGGPQTLFQRAESSAFFGREIGVMYMHAHLRYAQMLAHMGQAQAFFDALAKAHPIALREIVPSASLRQANCYYSSSDAAFPDRYQAQEQYGRINEGQVALDGGWRIYSSGPGIAIALVVCSFLGLRREHTTLLIDPVMPPALDGLCTTVDLAGQSVEVTYRLGPAGCGPLQLELDGQPLAFERRANPYRLGAAAVPMSALASSRPATAGASRRLLVHTG